MHNELPALLRYQDLQQLFKVSRSSLARWEAKLLFPKRVIIGENSIGWRSDQIKQWLQDRSNTSQGV